MFRSVAPFTKTCEMLLNFIDDRRYCFGDSSNANGSKSQGRAGPASNDVAGDDVHVRVGVLQLLEHLLLEEGVALEAVQADDVRPGLDSAILGVGPLVD